MRPLAHQPLRLRSAASAIAVLAAAVAIAPAPARADLLDPLQLTISQPGAVDPRAAIGPDGTALVAWRQSDGVWAAWRRPRGRFDKPFRLGAGQLGALVATADGHMVVTRLDGERGAVTLLRTGRTSGPEVVLSEGAWAPPEVAVDGHGGAIAAAGDRERTVVAVRTRGEPFGAPAILEDAANANHAPVAAANAAGDVAVAFGSDAGGAWAALRPAGATALGSLERVPLQGVPGTMQAVVTTAGDVAIAGHGFVPVGTGSSGAQLSYRPKGGSFQDPVDLDTDGHAAGLIAGPDNRVTVFDELRDPPGGGLLRAFDRSADGTLAGPQVISPPDSCGLDPAVTPRNDTIVAFFAPCSGGGRGGLVMIAERPAGLLFAPPLPVSPPDSLAPSLATNETGGVALAWMHIPDDGGPAGAVIQAVVREGPVELGFPELGTLLPVDATGLVTLTAACTGLRDCAGTVRLIADRGRARGRASGVRRRLAGRTVRIERGRSSVVRIRLPRGAIRARRTRVRLVVRLRGVRGTPASRSRNLMLERRTRRSARP